MSVSHTLPKRPAQLITTGNWRYFAETNPESGTPLRATIDPHRDGSSMLQVEVARRPKRDHAHLTFWIHGLGRIGPQLTSHQLRRLASDLLDAADDIDYHPASQLTAAANSTDSGARRGEWTESIRMLDDMGAGQ